MRTLQAAGDNCRLLQQAEAAHEAGDQATARKLWLLATAHRRPSNVWTAFKFTRERIQ